jgi:hypothetical protein
VLRHDNLASRVQWPERRARQRADDSAFAGPRSPAPRAPGGASGTRACRAQKLRLHYSEYVASYAWPLLASTLFFTVSAPLLRRTLRTI